MKEKIILFVVWFLITSGLYIMTLLVIAGRVKVGVVEWPEIYGQVSLALSILIVIYGAVQWRQKKLDMYQETMTIFSAIIVVVATVAVSSLFLT